MNSNNWDKSLIDYLKEIPDERDPQSRINYYFSGIKSTNAVLFHYQCCLEARVGLPHGSVTNNIKIEQNLK